MQSPPTTVLQLTKGGRELQSENGPITAKSLIDGGLIGVPSASLGLYLHVPFCFHKCHYCDFYSIVDSRDRQAVFTYRMVDELHAIREIAINSGVESIFIGGGTPTLLQPHYWRTLLSTIATTIRPTEHLEFTVEANPETVNAELAGVLVEGGVNRVSIGAQSFNPAHLKVLERWHDPANVGRSVDILRREGIDSMNLDLIFAIPGQTLEQWLADLDAALALQPDHLSCYGLTYEPNTPMTAKLNAGRFEPADQELEAAMYTATVDRLAAAGFEHYEVSAWARPGKRCRHNLRYWTNGNWWPLGPSASGHVDGVRWKNVPRLGTYLESASLPPIVDVENLDDDGRVGETLMLSLRLIDGLALEELAGLLALGDRGEQRRAAIDRHTADGLLEQVDGRLRLTQHGLLLADTVLADMV